MFRKLLKNKKAQNVAEYALLIALVVAAVIAMQTYAQRALQAKIRDTSAFMTSVSGSLAGNAALGTTAQYEPYYLHTDYDVTTSDSDTQLLVSNTVRQEVVSNRMRGAGGFQVYTYDNSKFLGAQP